MITNDLIDRVPAPDADSDSLRPSTSSPSAAPPRAVDAPSTAARVSQLSLPELTCLRRQGTNICLPVVSVGVVTKLYNEKTGRSLTVEAAREDVAAQLGLIEWFVHEFDLPIGYAFMRLSLVPAAVAMANGKGNPIQIMDELNEGVTPMFHLHDLASGQLIVPDPAQHPLLSKQIEVVRKAKASNAFKARTLLAFVPGPISLLGMMIDAQNLALSHQDYPECFPGAMAYASRVIERLSLALAAAGADAICMLEPSMQISPLPVATLAVPRINGIFGHLRRRGVSCVLHVCGNTKRFFKVLAGIDAHGFSLDADVSLREFAQTYVNERPREIVPVVVIGNYSTFHLRQETARETLEQCRRMIRDNQDFPPGALYLPASGCELRLLKAGANGRMDAREGLKQLEALIAGMCPQP